MNQRSVSLDNLFRSFWIAGFEGASHINLTGQRIDMLAITQHDKQAEADYRRLKRIGIETVRESIRWPLVDTGQRYDFSVLAPFLHAALQQDMQVIWTLCHYGVPDDVDIFSSAFVERFTQYARATAEYIAAHTNEQPFYTLINEISFLSWAGDVGYIYPGALGRGHELKRQLVRATIAGIEAIWSVEPHARIVHIDPLIHIVPPLDRPDLAHIAASERESQFLAWDMLAGLREPELGGALRYLDILGLNYYHSNQWEHPTEQAEARLRWEDMPRDIRWEPLHRLLSNVSHRYQRPILISETSHFGEGRGAWIEEIAQEIALAHKSGVPIEGICVYPILDRPDWDDLNHWHNSGLWDLIPDERGVLQRILNKPYFTALQRAQNLMVIAKERGL
jgi:beta-glucosidase/6-phospho-beta-glucosidase/beta-galactosidase